MFKNSIVIRIVFLLLLVTQITYACGVYTCEVPIADIYVNVDAKQTKTSFSITWKFKEKLLHEHDKNKNNKFDKDELQEIEDEYINHLEKSNFITEIVYVKKGQRVKKSLIETINLRDSKLSVSGLNVKYTYEFDTNFILEKNHRLFIRFLDPTEKVYVELKDIVVDNYNGEKVIAAQKIRANIYFYEYKKKYKSLKDAILVK